MTREEELKQIIEKYKSGKSSTQIAEEHFTTANTICNCLEKAGVKRRSSGRIPLKIPAHVKQMIINDWNADATSTQIGKKYGLFAEEVGSLLFRWRRQGSEIKYKRKLRKD